MKFFLASFAWIAMGTILGVSIYMLAVKGNPWPLTISSLAFVFAIGKIGCAVH